jgi:hypothetical protein
MLSNESSLKTIKKIFPRKLQVNVPVFFGLGKGMCKSYTGLMEAPGPKYSFIFVSTPSFIVCHQKWLLPPFAFLSLHFL